MTTKEAIKYLSTYEIQALLLAGPISFFVNGKQYTVSNWNELDAAVEDICANDLRMYVFVKSDMPYIHKAVQGAHAVAQFLIEHPDTKWKNGTIVYLDATPEQLLELKCNSDYSVFMEPDWDIEPVHTATALVSGYGKFANFKTVKMPRGLLSKYFK